MVNKKYFILISVAILFSISCFASEESSRPVSKPACAPYCEKIDTVLFVFVDEINVLNSKKKSTLLDGLEKIVKLKGSKVRINNLDMDKVAHYYQPITSMISAEVRFHQDDNKSIIKIGVNIIAPNRFYSNEFICSIKDDFLCINEKFKKNINKNIEDYLFKPSGGTIQ